MREKRDDKTGVASRWDRIPSASGELTTIHQSVSPNMEAPGELIHITTVENVYISNSSRGQQSSSTHTSTQSVIPQRQYGHRPDDPTGYWTMAFTVMADHAKRFYPK